MKPRETAAAEAAERERERERREQLPILTLPHHDGIQYKVVLEVLGSEELRPRGRLLRRDVSVRQPYGAEGLVAVRLDQRHQRLPVPGCDWHQLAWGGKMESGRGVGWCQSNAPEGGPMEGGDGSGAGSERQRMDDAVCVCAYPDCRQILGAEELRARTT